MAFSSSRLNWSNRFIPAARQIIGPHLLQPSTFQQDVEEAADLIVLRLVNADMSFALRVRKAKYADSPTYRNQITIRTSSGSGQTEEQKILAGFGSWFLYGFSDQAEAQLQRWVLIDLAVYRQAVELFELLGSADFEFGKGSNWDGSTFRWIDVPSFRRAWPNAIIDASPGYFDCPERQVTQQDLIDHGSA